VNELTNPNHIVLYAGMIVAVMAALEWIETLRTRRGSRRDWKRCAGLSASQLDRSAEDQST
jgi:hypothetical protein